MILFIDTIFLAISIAFYANAKRNKTKTSFGLSIFGGLIGIVGSPMFYGIFFPKADITYSFMYFFAEIFGAYFLVWSIVKLFRNKK